MPDDMNLEQWTRLLQARRERLERLLRLRAPDVILDKEREMIGEAEAAVARLLRKCN